MIVLHNADWIDDYLVFTTIKMMFEENEDKPLVSKKGIFVDLILSTAFFLFMALVVLRPHVPSEDPTAVLIVSGMASLCITGIFWLATNMFRVTLVDFQRSKKN